MQRKKDFPGFHPSIHPFIHGQRYLPATRKRAALLVRGQRNVHSSRKTPPRCVNGIYVYNLSNVKGARFTTSCIRLPRVVSANRLLDEVGLILTVPESISFVAKGNFKGIFVNISFVKFSLRREEVVGHSKGVTRPLRGFGRRRLMTFFGITRGIGGNYRGETGVSRLISCRKEQGGNAIVIARDPCKRCCSPTRPSLRAFLHDRKHYLTSLPRIRACRGKFTRVSNRAPTESR